MLSILINITRPTKNQSSKRKLLPQYQVKYVKMPKLRFFKKLHNEIRAQYQFIVHYIYIYIYIRAEKDKGMQGKAECQAFLKQSFSYNRAPALLAALCYNRVLLLSGTSKPSPEILLHEGKAITQLDLWFPSQQLICFCDIWLSLARIIWCVLHHCDLHIRVDQLRVTQ